MRPWEARFGLELDWEKLWRDQVFGAKVRPWEACFGSELDWEKLWRDQVFGAKMTETNGHKLLFFLGFRGGVRQPKCDHGTLVLEQN